MELRETKFKIGSYYQNNIDGTIFICVDNTLEAGGERENMLSKYLLKEISPDQVPGCHTSVKNTHPTTEDFNKLQAIGPQGQIAETKRRDFWCRTVISYTGAANSVDVNKCIAWADHCLEQFDKRFNNK